ncbi:MAG: VOC family protein [Phototrophicaceae bacterium]
MSILGLHHITLVSADAQRTLNFYVQVLGLRLVKQTVNFDDPSSYHLYFGDAIGSPGTAITFFEWRGAPRGRRGIGGTHHFALTVPDEVALLKWKRRLIDHQIQVKGPYDRRYFQSIYFNDPDGVIVEIATAQPGFTVDEAQPGQHFMSPPEDIQLENQDDERIQQRIWADPVPLITHDMALTAGMHHISAITADIERTHAFFGEILGMERVKMTANFDDPTSVHWYWGVNGGQPGTLITYFERPYSTTRASQMGTGHTHHFALAVEDEQTQQYWRERLIQSGLPVSPVMDRDYFKSIYTRDPFGHIVELATREPGFAVDEPVETLGQRLQLPAMHERLRSKIEAILTPLVVPHWQDYYEGERGS